MADGLECNENVADGLNKSGDKGRKDVGDGFDSSDDDYVARSESSDEDSVFNCSQPSWMLSDCEESDDDTFGDLENGQGKNTGGSSEPGKETEPEVEGVNNLR